MDVRSGMPSGYQPRLVVREKGDEKDRAKSIPKLIRELDGCSPLHINRFREQLTGAPQAIYDDISFSCRTSGPFCAVGAS